MAIIDGYPATSFSAKDRAWVKAVADNSADKVLPDVTAADNGKILGVDSGEWNKVDAPSGLPSVTAADNGKILGVDNGAWSKVDAPSSLPSVTATDNGSSLGVINGAWGVMPNPTGKIKYIELSETDDGYETAETVTELWEMYSNNDFVYVGGLGVPVLALLEMSETSPLGTYFAIVNVPPYVYRDNNEIKLLAYSYMSDPASGSEKLLFTWDSEIEGDFLPSTN